MPTYSMPVVRLMMRLHRFRLDIPLSCLGKGHSEHVNRRGHYSAGFDHHLEIQMKNLLSTRKREYWTMNTRLLHVYNL